MNWIDWLILLMFGVGLINGFREGFVRIVIGFAAMVVAFFAASWFHGYAAAYLTSLIGPGVLASIGGYALIFIAVILIGTVIAGIIVRLLGLVGLTLIDRVLGAGLGVVRAGVTLMIAAMLIMAFAPNRLPAAVRESKLAPYLLRASDMISTATPNHIRSRVETTYDELRGKLDKVRPRSMQLRHE